MKVALILPLHARHDATRSALDRLALRLRERGDEVTIVCREAGAAPGAGIRIHALAPFGLTAAWKAKAFAKAVEDCAARERFDVVLSYAGAWTHDVVRLSEGCLATLVARMQESEGDKVEKDPGRSAGELAAAIEIEARSLAKGSYRFVLVPSELVGNDAMARFGVFPELVRLVPPGVDLERFHPSLRATKGRETRRALRLEDEDFVVLFAAPSFARGGLDRVLRLLPEVARERPRVRLLVAGDDPARAHFEALAAAGKVEDRVRFAGLAADMAAFHAASDLLFQPARTSPCSESVLEALASGVPAVTSSDDGAAAFLEQDVTGSILHEAGHKQTLYKALLAWTRPERATEAGRAGRAAAEAHSLQRQLDAEVAVVDEAAAARRADP